MSGPAQVATSWPLASSTSRQPSPLVRVVPSVLGVLPTITQPLFSIVIAVVRPTPPGHCGKLLRQLGEQRRLPGGRVVVDDRRAGALQVREVVEIVDQHVVLLDLPGRDRRDDDGIGVVVAVVRHGRGQGDVLVDGLQEAVRLVAPARRPSAIARRPATPARRRPRSIDKLRSCLTSRARPVVMRCVHSTARDRQVAIRALARSEQDVGAQRRAPLRCRSCPVPRRIGDPAARIEHVLEVRLELPPGRRPGYW